MHFYRKSALSEPLEPRRLLAGVTILTHGFNSSAGDGTWVDRMGDAIADRLGGASVVPQYLLSITGTSSAPTAHSVSRDAGTPEWGVTGDSANPSGEVIVKLDWGAVSASSGVSTTEVADYTAGVLLGSPLLSRSLLEVPIHLIGHSRGASLMARLAQKLGEAGLWVDQLTMLDPHPVDGVNEPPLLPFNWGDAPMQVFGNVVYADNYYRPANSNQFDFAGEPVTGAVNNGPLNLPGGSSLDHSDVHAYYHGTIDRDATTDSAGGPIVASWFASTIARATGGYDQSRLGRGVRLTANIGSTFGGGAARVAVAITRPAYFSNVGFMTLSGPAGATAFSTGQSAAIDYRYQAPHAASTTVQFFVDTNSNPYDSGAVPLGTPQLVAPASSSAGSFAFNWPSLAPGEYRISARILNPDGLQRFAIAETPVVVTASGAVRVISREWTGEIPGVSSFTDPRNWQPGGAPAAGDRVLIPVGVATIADAQLTASVDLTGQGRLALDPAGVLRTGAIGLQQQGTLDLGRGAAIVDYDADSPLAGLLVAVSAARAGGTWAGPGVTSSAIATQPGAAVGLGEASHVFGAFPASFAGQNVDATTLLLRRTLEGDATLNGTVDIDDFGILASRFNEPGIWSQGDFNYSLTTDIDDFGLLASRFNLNLTAATGAGARGGVERLRPFEDDRPLFRLVDQIVV